MQATLQDSVVGSGERPHALSFVVPAYNEARQIAAVVEAIRASAIAVGVAHEIIVVDDDSDDGTADLARAAGATVVGVHKRNIAAVRNAGAAGARHDVLVFVDGDTFLNPETLTAALAALEGGAVGGGALCRFDEAGRLATLAVWIATRGLALFRKCGGCFVFVRRTVFETVGGFDEELFASEEIGFATSVSRHGRFVVVREPIVTSGRKARRYSVASLLLLTLRIGLRGPRGLRRREGLELWYDGQREAPATGADG